MDVLEYVDFAFYDILTREPDKALVVAQKAYQARKVPYIGLLTAVLANRLDNVAEPQRACLNKSSIRRCRTIMRRHRTKFYKRLAVLMRDTVTTKKVPQLDLAQFDKLQAETPSDKVYPSTFPYFVGVFLKNRGDLQNTSEVSDSRSPVRRLGVTDLRYGPPTLAEHEVKIPEDEPATK